MATTAFPASARRARLVERHRLGGRTASGLPAPAVPSRSGLDPSPGSDEGIPPRIEELAGRLVGLHATDPATPYLSAWARLPGFIPGELDHRLYGAASMTKQLCMRRTLFVVPADLLPTVQAACTEAVAANERRRLVAGVEGSGLAADGPAWLAGTRAAVLAALAERGPSTGASLSRVVPEIQAKIVYAEGTKWGGEVGVATRVFTVLAAEGDIRRGPPTGGWTSSQHRWELAPPAPPPPPEPEAVRTLIERWLRAFGPATVDDVVWWTGLGVRKVRAALTGLDLVEVDLDGVAGIGLAGDADLLDPTAATSPAAVLLPALDPTVMGWKHRSWYLGPHAGPLFDRSGNAGPTVWWDGRVVGGWVQRRSGEVAVRLLEDVGSEAASAAAAEAAELERWLGATIVSSRFPCPLEKELRA